MTSMKKLLMTGGIAVTLLTTSALYAVPSHAQQVGSVSLSPVTGWAVSKVGDVNTGDGYCALARRFTESYVVTIAQNNNGEASLAFDFQRSLFDINSSYEVSISAGGHIARYDIIANATSGLVIKLGRNNKLLQEVEASQNLSLNVDGVGYNFEFSGFKSGRDQLQTCLGRQEQVVRAQVERQMGSQVNMMRDELNQLQSENRQLLQQLENERNRFSNQLQGQQGDNVKINALVNELREAEQNNSQLMAQLQSEKNTSNSLKSRIVSIMARSGQAAENVSEGAVAVSVQAAQEERAELMAMLNAERQRRAEIEAIVAQKSNIDEQKSELAARINELERMNSNLAMKLDRQQSSSSSLGQGTSASLVDEQEFQAMRNENTELKEKIALLSQNKIGENSSLLDAARKSLFETQAKYQRLNIEKEALEKQLQSERQQFMQQTSQNNQPGTSQSSEALARQLVELSNENNRLRSTLQKTSKPSSELAGAELDEKLALKNQDVAGMEQEISDLKNMLDNERKERMSLSRTLADMSIRGASTDTSSIERVYEDRLARLQAENKALRSSVMTEKSSSSSAKVSPTELQAARMQIAQKASKLELVSSERDELKDLLDAERARRVAIAKMLDQKTGVTEERSELNAKLRQLEARNLELSRALDVAKNKTAKTVSISEVNAVPPILGGKGNDITQGHDVRTQLEIALAERDEYRNLLQKERSQLRDVHSLRSRIGNVQEDQASINDTIRALQNERVDLLRQLEYERARLDALPDGDPRKTARPQMVKDPSVVAELENTKAERDMLQKRVESMSSGGDEQMELLERMLNDAQKSETQMTRRVANLEQERQQLNSLLKEAQRSANNAKQDVNEFADRNQKVASAKLKDTDSDQDRMLTLEEENRRLYSEIQGLQARKTEIDSIQAELVSVEAQNDILRRELTEYRGKASTVVADEDMIAHLRGTIDRLSMQNDNLQEALELSRTREVQKADGNQYRKKLMDAQTRIQAVMVENASLSRELEEARQNAENVLMSAQNEDLDLARASVRYKEAEREIDRLSDVLRQERSKHAAEVSDLENKLFDPAITEEEQIRKLQNLEAEIARLRNSNLDAVRSQPVTIDKNAEHQLDFIAEKTAVPPMIMDNVDTFEKADVIVDGNDIDRVNHVADAKQSQSSIQRLRQRISKRPDIDNNIPNYASSRSSKGNGDSIMSGSVEFVANEPQIADVELMPAPSAIQAQSQASGALPSAMSPIMDGPGEAALAAAVQRGGGVYVNERQVQVASATPQMQSNNIQTASVEPMNANLMAKNRQAQMMQPVMRKGPNGQDIATLLVDAGVPMVSGFEKVDSVSSDQFSAFRWDTGTVYGSAEMTNMASGVAFNNAIEGYLRKTEARCAGSFDKTLSSDQSSDRKNIISYDIACVSNEMQGAGAAVVFFLEGGTFNVIAHEAGLEEFSQAMSTRDQIANILIR